MSESQSPLSSPEEDARFQKALEWIDRLKQEPFHQATERQLDDHPFLRAAQQGTLTLAQQRAFVCEQWFIQRSDAVSFASLAGHEGFRPNSLMGITTPAPISGGPHYQNFEDLFQFLLEGELFAAPLLLDHARSLGLDGAAALQSYARAQPGLPSGRAQAYPAYWARLALGRQRAAGAAACAVNFPAWGRMCGRLATAYQRPPPQQQQPQQSDRESTDTPPTGGSSSSNKDLAFIEFFATPIDNLDEMAAAVMMQDPDITYEEIADHVRLLQEYEVLFWDGCYHAT